MAIRYTEAFIEQALIKVYSRGDRTIKSVAEELNVNCHTVKNWMERKSAKVDKPDVSAKEKRPRNAGRQSPLASVTPTAPRGTAPSSRTASETQISTDPFETELDSLP